MADLPTIIDCTVRDGGLANAFDFSLDTVQAIYREVSATGVPVIELGYMTSPDLMERGKLGVWRFCTDELLRDVVGDAKKAKLAVMVDVGRVHVEAIPPRDQSCLDWIRVAFYLHQVDEALVVIAAAVAKGYQVSANLMAVSHARHRTDELNSALHKLAQSPVTVVYVVDSNGALYPQDVTELVQWYRTELGGKPVGMHAHNNLQLAFANTLVALDAGATYADATVFGIGRGAGNCPLELLLAHLQGVSADLKPLLRVIREQLIPQSATCEWGYTVPYVLTGMTDQHPRKAIALRNSDYKDNYEDLLDDLLSS